MPSRPEPAPTLPVDKVPETDAAVPERIDDAFVALYRSTAEGAYQPILGLQTAAVVAALNGLAGRESKARPELIESGELWLLRVPAPGTLQHVWVLRPAGTAAGKIELIRRYTEASRRLAAGAVPAAQAPPVEPPADAQVGGRAVMDRLRAVMRQTPGRPRAWLGEMRLALARETGWPGVGLLQVRGDRLLWCELTVDDASKLQDSLRVFITQLVAQGQRCLRSSQPWGEAPSELDKRLLLEEHGLSGFSLFLPAGAGVALYVAADVDEATGLELVDLLSLRAAPRASLAGRLRSRRGLTAVVALLGLALLWPIPMEVGAPATLVPADSQVIVATQAGKLAEIQVGVGDQVRAGDVLARMTAPELIEADLQASLDAMLQSLNAKEALSRGDYGEYRILQQREAVSALQVEQGQRRLQELEIRAPADGRIADVLTPDQLGALKAAGDFVAELQFGSDMHVLIDLGAADAAQVEPGMPGDLVVRGVIGQSFPIRVLTHPVARSQPDGQSTTQVLAAVERPAQSAAVEDLLFKGLTGFARLDGPRRPRIYVWTRPAIEYLQLAAWKYLGLPL
ncbi:MAG: biotin/lipoyl-binding protein [Pseudomonadota bacterium]|nr:biotin/lipoyl-binding protein [Pseudomonadota bacterium]